MFSFAAEFFEVVVGFRHRVNAAFAKWIAAQNALYRKPSAFDRAKARDRLNGVRRASRIKTASRWKQRRNTALIKSYQQEKKMFHAFLSAIRCFFMMRLTSVEEDSGV